MSQENVDTVRRALEAWNSGDLEAWLAAVSLDPAVEMRPVIAELVEGAEVVYRGIPGARRFWEDWRVGWNFRFVDVDFRDAGDSVVAITEASVTSARTGLDLDTPMAMVCEYRDGRLVRLTSYLEEDQALEAVGLRE
jgi:ketosteroid isomerase-like protein